jgi:FAD/FMN-containing dehydrogenase
MTASIRNFGNNITLKPQSVYSVSDESEVLAILNAHAGQPMKAIGSLHAWSAIAETDGVVIEMSSLNSVQIADDKASVWIGAGCKVKRALRKLSGAGLTLPSVGLIDEQTVAGATATGTHGSGKNSLSHFIEAVRVAHYDAASGKATISTIENGDALRAARCSLGLMGVIVAIKFSCRPKYNVQEHARGFKTLADVMAMERQYPLQQFYLMPWSWNYFGHHRVESTADRSKLATLYRLYCFSVIDVGLHLAVTFLARWLQKAWAIRSFFRFVLPWTIVPNWKVVDDSHAMLVMEHELFRHIEIEVFVPRSKVEEATELLIDVLSVFGGQPKRNLPRTDALLNSIEVRHQLDSLGGSYVHHYPICYRRVLPDDTLLSMTSRSNHADSDEDWYAISFISYQLPDERDGFFKFANFVGPLVAKLYGGRCHWGKYNPLTADQNRELYPQLDAFVAEVSRIDPEGRFSNRWLSRSVRVTSSHE